MRLPRDLSGDALARALAELGYRMTRQTGSHLRLTTLEHGEHHVTEPGPSLPGDADPGPRRVTGPLFYCIGVFCSLFPSAPEWSETPVPGLAGRRAAPAFFGLDKHLHHSL